MDRRQRIEKCFQKGRHLNLTQPSYSQHVSELVSWLLAGDQVTNDCTTQALQLNERVSAVVVSKQTGVIAGIEEATTVLVGQPDISFESNCGDGATVQPGQAILSFEMPIGMLLSLERTILNIIGRMSGIATQTQRMVGLAQQNGGTALIAGTRKTPWMLLDKKAIYCGGGLTHRLS